MKIKISDNLIHYTEIMDMLGICRSYFYTLVKRYNLTKEYIHGKAYYKKDEIYEKIIKKIEG